MVLVTEEAVVGNIILVTGDEYVVLVTEVIAVTEVNIGVVTDIVTEVLAVTEVDTGVDTEVVLAVTAEVLVVTEDAIEDVIEIELVPVFGRSPTIKTSTR